MSDLENEVSRTAEEAVAMARARGGGALDYSEASLQVVEEILAEAASYAASLSSAEMEKLAQYFGCYILEVGRRTFGGSYRWFAQRDQPVLVVGEPDFHVAIIGWDKVRARLTGDPADNIPFFFAGFAERVRAAAPGMKALYV